MASYLDQPYQFKPYVATQPVEAMVKVGMLKQQQYDEGVQKIRNLLDEQTMLPVSRAVDIQYLQNAVNSVTGEIKKLGAADFSNQQLVQSVGGLTKRISKDPYILDAVASTEHRKSELARRQELEKAGKTSINNDIVFNQDWNDYYNSTDMGRRFSSTYTPYTDVNKKAVEVIKGLHSNLQKIDDPFEIINGIKTGRLADVLKKYSAESVTEGQIMTALRAAFTPDDYNQLRIDGKVQFMGVNGEKLAQTALNDYETSKKQMQEGLEAAKKMLPVYAADPNKQAEINEAIKTYEDQLGKDGLPGKLELKYTQNIKNIKENPEEVKYEIYKDGFFRQFGNGFKWAHMSEEVADSPYYKVAADKRAFNYQMSRDAVKDAQWFETHKLALKELDLKYGLTDTGEPNWQRSGNDTTQKNEGVQNFNAHIGDLKAQESGARQELLNKGLTNGQIDAMLAENERTGGLISDPINGPKIQELAKLKNNINTLTTFNDNLRKEIDKEVGLDATIKKYTAGKQGLRINVGGRTMDLSAEDLLALRNARVPNYTSIPGPGGTANIENFGLDTSRLNSKQREAAKVLEGVYFNVPRNAAVSNIPGLHNALEGYNTANAAISNVAQEAYQKYVDRMGDVSSKFVTRLAGAPTTKEGKVPPSVLGTLDAAIKARTDLDIAGNKDFNRSTALGLLKDAENAKVTIENAGNSYRVIISSFADPDADPQILRVDKDFVSKTFGENYLNKYVEEGLFLDAGKGDMNITNNPQNAYYQKKFGDFPGITKYNIKGNVERVTGAKSVVPKIFLEDVNGNFLTFYLAGESMKRVTGLESAVKGFGSITDDQLEKLIRQSYPNFDLKTLKKYR